ncbi:hypothetical protein FRX31_002786 [Thalictrum thalictroides]|uniref:B3 domain-containing protein n=1 Tax=Thalictrum thalictroides TaxID=46969 RepID=A0A7J6XFB2_THATH|nr:hypothetical protein FRX31_002786 [Thalictrum thalictroides]
MEDKERRLKALHYLAKKESDSCEIFQGNRKASSKLITLLSLSSLPLPPLPQQKNDDDRKLEELRNSVSPTTPLEYFSTPPSSSSSLEAVKDGSSSPIQLQRPKTLLVIKEGNKKLKPKTNRKGKEQVNYPPRDMPKYMFDLITGKDVQGKNIRWFTTKLIYISDILSSQNRLLLPNPNKLEEEVLTSNEIKHMASSKNHHIEVHVFDPKLVVRKLNMSYWPGQGKYVLITLWSELAAANGLVAKGHFVDVWTFRNQLEKLCFVVDFRKVDEEDDEDPAGICGATTSGHGVY